MVGRAILYYFDQFVFGVELTCILIVLSFIYTNNRRHYKRIESIALFVFTLFTTVPFNAIVCFCCMPVLLHFKGVYGMLVIVLSIPLVYTMLLAAEEIILGLIGRIIWPQQRRFFDKCT